MTLTTEQIEEREAKRFTIRRLEKMIKETESASLQWHYKQLIKTVINSSRKESQK